ncbi:unnamed protein product [Darwinula stevensoni]|uniref:Uncharacterized protein n=1 Tax=Darwinula stevensoni TaxID=69355 RepID=A0A7R8XBV2_9CRUS|nr:unnamed protein product [Darwinula stevensoni]CAG0891905.1 unnamed protein product [Darwinula stevensoni]
MELENVTKIFRDVAEKVYLFCSFADSPHLPVRASVEEAGLKYKRHYPVNSSAYFAKNEEYEKDKLREVTKAGSINEFLSKMTMDSIRNFFKDIQKNTPILYILWSRLGKSMLVEVMGNYGLGVSFRDPYRFRVKVEGRTREIVSHTFYTRDERRFPQAVTLIETPGFFEFETGMNQLLAGYIPHFIRMNGLGIHAIVYVVPCSQHNNVGIITNEFVEDFLVVEAMGNYGLGVSFRDPYRFRRSLLTGEISALSHMVQVFAGEERVEEVSYMFLTFPDGKLHSILESAKDAEEWSYMFLTFPDGKLHSILESAKDAGMRSKKIFSIDCSSYFAQKNGDNAGPSTNYDEKKGKESKKGSTDELLFHITTKKIKKFLKEIQGNEPICISKPPHLMRKEEEKVEDVEAGMQSMDSG